MRPEKAVPQIELGEDEKVILEILNSQEEPMTLAEVKKEASYQVKMGQSFQNFDKEQYCESREN
jgi:hypothetical protein